MLKLCMLIGLVVAPYASADVGVVVVGDAAMQPHVMARLEDWLRTRGHSVVPAPMPPDAINLLIDCFVVEDPACARKIVGKSAKTSAVVFAKIDIQVDGTDRLITVVGHWLDRDRDAVSERKTCERCDEAMLHRTTDAVISEIVARAGAGGGTVKLTSIPVGAQVEIDGKPAGLTPLERDLLPGVHKLTMRHDRRVVTTEFTITRGQTTTLDVPMSEAPRARTPLLPKLMIGLGVAMIAGGVVLFAIDEDVPQRMGPQQPTYRDTAPIGVGLAAGGVVVTGIGTYLYLKSRRSSKPTLAFDGTTFQVGWAGRF